jgi:hypothetical protein
MRIGYSFKITILDVNLLSENLTFPPKWTNTGELGLIIDPTEIKNTSYIWGLFCKKTVHKVKPIYLALIVIDATDSELESAYKFKSKLPRLLKDD